MNIASVNTGIVKNRKPKRLGRGKGTGQGKTAGRGHKGFGSRNGSSSNVIFEGGQMPLVRRIPKRGFNNADAQKVAIVNLELISACFEEGETVSPETLKEKGVLKYRYDVLKILGDGDLEKKLKFVAHRFSKSAEEKIKALGCEIEILPGKEPLVKFQKKEKNA